MSDEKRSSREPGRKFSFGNIFYHNTFVLIFSFCVALIIWFVMASQQSESNRKVSDVPITPKLSAAAEADGLRVFGMSYSTADLEISGNSLITGKLTADDFEVTATLNPTSTKLTGNTLQKMTVPVRAAKKTAVSDYSIVSVNPEEINVEYDRYKEITLNIESDIKYSADNGFASGQPTFSEDRVTISGPESSVNKISRVAVSYSFNDPLRSDQNLSCPIRLFDQNNQEIADTTGLYLELSVDTVEVSISILPKKTVRLVASTVRQPKGFSSSRITVEPAQIDIAGPADVLSGIQEIMLDTPIDFSELDVGRQNSVTLDIPLPAGVKNLSASGENAVSQATVSVNLNGYKKVAVEVPAGNIQFSNQPAGKEIVLDTRALSVAVIGSDAQVSKLTGSALSVQADLTNFAEYTGTVDVPVNVTISGSGADSCWVLGSYTVSVTLQQQSTAVLGNLAPAGNNFFSSAADGENDGLNAAPQE